MTPLAGLEASAFGQAVRDWYPAVKILHLCGVALLLGTIVTIDLRLLGLLRQRSVKGLAGKLLPWTAGSFLVIVPTGLAMFVGYAGDLIANQVFAVKICLILCAGVNAAAFHAGAYRGAASWDVGVPPPAAARAAGALSLALWAGVVTCALLL
ncbi:MAG TPA: hypothetical protein VM140_03350 [Burkholderiales bacterium]|nr:hypothetical protein [Burkholderiales bacterium]